MNKKLYLNILRGGVFLSFLTFFFVFKNLLFPYITSKQISFNIIIEILFVFWLAFIIKYPEERPKNSYITYGLVSYFSVILLTCFTGIDFNLSFWGDVERMLGVFPLLHFFALYFIIITAFRDKKSWNLFLTWSIIIASTIALYGIAQNKLDSTLGNTEYLAGFLIFNIYFCLLLFFSSKDKGLRWLYLIPLPLYLWSFKKADISGAYVGLGFSLIVMFFLYSFLSEKKKFKILLGSFSIIFVVAVALLFLNKKSDFVQNNSFLAPIKDISLSKNSFQTRLISWRAALKDSPNHLYLGTGYGNFAVSFDKYFDPKFYNYTRQETYFDKAHNNLIEVFSTTGVFGLVSYLSIFAALAWYLINGYIKKKIGVHQFVLISSLLTAYFIHNLAVFDALVTYVMFMMALGFVHFLSTRDDVDELKEKKGIEKSIFINREIYALVFSGAFILIIIYQYNLRPFQMLTGTISGQKSYMQGQIVETLDIYKKTLGLKTILDRDSRTSLINVFLSNPMALSKLNEAQRKDAIDFLIEAAQANVDYNKKDSLSQMLLAQVYNLAAMYNAPNNGVGDARIFNDYSNKALEAINGSIEASPGRIPIYFQKAQIYLTRGDKDNSIATLKYAENLNPDYPDSFCYAGKALLLFGQEKEAYDHISRCIDMYFAYELLTPDVARNYMAYYEKQNDLERVIRLYEILTLLEKDNADNWVKLANYYKEESRKEDAKNAAQKVIEINSALEPQAKEFIESLN